MDSEGPRATHSASIPAPPPELDVSIIVLTYNRKDALKQCLMSLALSNTSQFSSEVIVVDCGSTDGTQSMVRDCFPTACLLTHDAPVLPCQSLQEGTNVARGKYALRVDDDNIVAPDMINELMHAAIEDPRVAFCGAVAFDTRGNVAWNRGTRFSKFLTMSVPADEPLEPTRSSPIYDVDLVDNVYLFRRELVKMVGGFGPLSLFPWSLEDAVPQVRLKAIGYRIVSSLNARTTHQRQRTTLNIAQSFYLTRSRIVFMRRILGIEGFRFEALSVLFTTWHFFAKLAQVRPGPDYFRLTKAMMRAYWEGRILASLPPDEERLGKETRAQT